MFSNLISTLLLPTLLLSNLTSATQIDKRSVGALTPLSSKTKICNILDYGAVADNKTDLGPAIKSAFSSCAISGGATIYIPPGSYALQTGVSPSQNVLIEDVYCNQSGGMSIGSLTADGVTSDTAAAVSNITMRNIYIYQCTQMLMIKTFPGGTSATGYVKDSVFENFWAYDTTYGLDIDQYWESHTTPDTGAVALSSLTFNNWTGTVDNGISRGPIVIRGSDIVPLTDITLSNFSMWTVNQNKILNQCKNVYGTGYCAATSKAGASLMTFTTTATTTSPPAGFTSPTKPEWGVAGYGVTVPIPVYTPAVFWSPVSSGVVSGSSSATVKAVVKTSSSVSVPASTTKAVAKTSSPSVAVVKSSTSLAIAVVASTKSTPSSSLASSTSAGEVIVGCCCKIDVLR